MVLNSNSKEKKELEEKRGEKKSTFFLQYSTPAAPPYVVLHITGVVGQICLLHSIKRQGQLHLLLP